MKHTIEPFHDRAEAFAEEIGEDPLVAHLLLARGIGSPEAARDFFSPDYGRHLHDPFLFPDTGKIVERVRRAAAEREIVGIFGDYDADGVTGSAILREALEGLGVRTVVHIPHKQGEGYGLSEKGLRVFRDAGAKLFFTVDCGITNVKEFAAAREMGLEGVVIDHHHVPEVMPEAIAIVNPKIPDCGYPFADLSGAGTAFKVAQGLYRALVPERERELKWLLDLASIGTVADCMPLIGENRVLVRFGSVVLAKTRRPGLRALYELARIRADDSQHPDAETIAFRIAPRINAAGRMAHAQVAHDLLVETNTERAAILASQLETHNDDRRKASTEITEAVRKRAQEECAGKSAIVLADKSYPPGIVGLVAGRIAEEFDKPAVILSRGEKTSVGSLRSAGKVHLAHVLAECDDLLEKYGGHKEAAGLTVSHEKFEAFRERFEALVAEHALGEEAGSDIDAEIFPEHLGGVFLERLKLFAPFGIGNPEPMFLLRGATIVDVRFLGNGEKHLKLKLRVESRDGVGHAPVDAIGFGMGEEHAGIAAGMRADVVGRLQENAWNGYVRPQVVLADIRLEEVV